MDRCSHPGVIDMTAALESLPTVSTAEQQSLRTTGTTDDSAKFGCTNGCTRPAEISCFQPKSPVSLATASNSGQKQESPQIPAENEGFFVNSTGVEQEASVGVEPTRDGFAIRCLSHLATTPKAGGNVVVVSQGVKLFLLRLNRQIFATG